MNDRIYEALTKAGLSTSPLSILDHASTYANAFFALYDNELLYHEAGRNSQVPLRDVTRIHSDREGVLRVETSERTAVTASLVGYDPGRVQAFFQQVRDVTARAKELPVVPLNPVKTAPAGLSSAAPAAPRPATPEQPVSAPALTPDPPLQAEAAAPVRRDAPRPEPVVISSMPPVSDPPSFQERSRQATKTASKPTEAPAQAYTAAAHTQGPQVQVPVAGTDDELGSPELLRRAEGVQGLARTVGLLAVVLGLAALALAYFQWQDNATLSALWTLLAGGVGSVALLAFAEALRLLAALARTANRSA